MKKIMKKLCSLIMAVMLIFSVLLLTEIDFSALFASAANAPFYLVEGETDDYFYTNDGNSDGLTVYAYKGNEKNVIIPSEINGIPVTIVNRLHTEENTDDEPYFDTSNVESIVVPDSVKVINGAFQNLVNLKSVTLPEGLEYIETDSFRNCTQLKEIEIPDSVYNMYDYMFYNSGIEELNIGGRHFEYINLASYQGSNIKTLTLNIPEVKLQNVALSGVDKIISNSMVGRLEPLESDPEGIVTNPNFELICKGGMLITSYYDYVTEKGLYHHYDVDNDIIAFKTYPAESKATYISGDYRYYLNAENEAVIDRYLGTDSVIVVPETVDGYTVTEIGSTAFCATFDSNKYFFGNQITTDQITSITLPDTIDKIGILSFGSNKSLTSINIPEGITHIPTMAFRQCTGLKNIDLPSTLKKIGPLAFYLCMGLTDIIVPEGVTEIGGYGFGRCESAVNISLPETLTTLGEYAFSENLLLTEASLPDSLVNVGDGIFWYCEQLESVKLPANLERIGARMFYRTALNSIDIPETVTEIGFEAFDESLGTMSSIVLPEGLKRIEPYAFAYLNHLSQIEIPSTLEYMGKRAFNNTAIEKLVLNCENLTKIGEYAFGGCDKLTEVEIGGGIKSIDKYAFYYCSKLKKVTFGDNVEKIYSQAFLKCTQLEEITIPENINYIGDGAFGECTMLKTVNFNARNAKTLGYACYCPFEKSYVKCVNISNTVERIDDALFANLTSLTEVNIADSVKEIGNYAFWECSSLAEINLPDSVEYIGSSAFEKCTSVKTAVLPPNIISINDRAFYGCTALTGVILPNDLQTIGASVFENCKGITEITLPEGLKKLDLSAFYNCTGIKTINFNAINCMFSSLAESEMEGIYYSPFYSCTSLEKIVLREDITSIPDYFFCGLKSISTVDIPASVTSFGKAAFAFSSVVGFTGCENLSKVGDYCFYKCENLGEIISGEGIIDIGSYVFAYSAVPSFVASDNLESIGYRAFAGCEKLRNISLGEKLMLISDSAFEGCTSLTELIMPDTVKNIGDKAFIGNTALKKVQMSANIVFIPDECFNMCTSLSEFNWSASSKLIGRLAFGNCSSLFAFDFIGIEKLYENSFYKSGIGVVTLGEAMNNEKAKLEEIEARSFMECDSLETVSIGGNITTVSSQAFANCNNLETAMISDNVNDIADDAFDGCDNLTIYCSDDSYAYLYAQSQGIKVSTFIIAPISNQTYTGYAIKPDVKVSMSGKSLVKNTDFSVNFSDNLNIGTARVKVNGMGDYKMFESSASFSIITADIKRASVSPIADQEYTGSPVKPMIVITYNGKLLKEGTDYSVRFNNNVKSGEATATVRGKGNFSGERTLKFNISEETPSFRLSSFFDSIFDAFISWIKSFFFFS